MQAGIWARAIAATAVAVLLLALPAAVVYRQSVRHQRDLAASEGAHLVDLEREFLTRELHAVHSDLVFLAQQPLLVRVLDGVPGAREELEREYERFAQSKPRYDQVRLLGRTGEEIVRVNRTEYVVEVVEAHRLQSKAER